MRQKRGGELATEDLARGKAFAEWLRLARAQRGLNKKQLADISGVSDTYIGVLDKDGINSSTGQYQCPSEEIISKLAKALNADENIGRIAAGYAPLKALSQSNRPKSQGIEIIIPTRPGPSNTEIIEIEGVELVLSNRGFQSGIPLVVNERTFDILRELARREKARFDADQPQEVPRIIVGSAE